MFNVRLSVFLVLACAACASRTGTDSRGPSAGSGAHNNQGVAFVQTTTGSTKLVFVNETNASRSSDVLAGTNPSGFQWILIELGPNRSTELASAASTHVDLTDATDGSVFSQEYSGPCNPANNDFNACWLFEKYHAGDVGLTGALDLHITNSGTIVEGDIDVKWSGLTNRFGDPIQQHTHETEFGIHAEVQSAIPGGVGQ